MVYKLYWEVGVKYTINYYINNCEGARVKEKNTVRESRAKNRRMKEKKWVKKFMIIICLWFFGRINNELFGGS